VIHLGRKVRQKEVAGGYEHGLLQFDRADIAAGPDETVLAALIVIWTAGLVARVDRRAGVGGEVGLRGATVVGQLAQFEIVDFHEEVGVA
jgi:hypothetical protein